MALYLNHVGLKVAFGKRYVRIKICCILTLWDLKKGEEIMEERKWNELYINPVGFKVRVLRFLEHTHFKISLSHIYSLL